MIPSYLKDYSISDKDLNRPWGGFYYINNTDLSKFSSEFFPNCDIDITNPISPKILIINPGKRLSFQYHNRRKEIWSVIKGPVGVVRSYTDDENITQTLQTGDIITIDKQERHRLIGLDNIAIVAELWCHTDINHLSDENDIIRLQDDYNRYIEL